MLSSSFDSWADVYDSVYSYVREDIQFYVEAAIDAGGPVLELGCGTGRVTIPIARAGVEVVGLDSSPAMLEVARRKLEAASLGSSAPTLVQADMTDFALDRRFNLVIVPFRGFLSLLTVRDQVDTLSSVKGHLSPNGKLIISIFVPDLNMLVQEGDVPYHLRDVSDPDTGKRHVLWHQSSYDNHNQIVNARIIAEELDDAGTMVRRFYRDFQLRYIYRWEMYHLLELCGFDILDVYGNFDGSPLDENSTEMVWVAGVDG